MTSTDSATLAEQVKILLANKGNTVSETRRQDGVHVTPVDGGEVSVHIAYLGLEYSKRRTRVIAEQLRDAGYQVAAESFPRTLLYVTEPALERAEEARS